VEQNRPALQRCAIYTRKSSEEGLEQDFNSLHAQREACEAFVKSQAGEGWRLINTAYDDGGLSGATMERLIFRIMKGWDWASECARSRCRYCQPVTHGDGCWCWRRRLERLPCAGPRERSPRAAAGNEPPPRVRLPSAASTMASERSIDFAPSLAWSPRY
jgi:Resolvase, N terminal domain